MNVSFVTMEDCLLQEIEQQRQASQLVDIHCSFCGAVVKQVPVFFRNQIGSITCIACNKGRQQ